MSTVTKKGVKIHRKAVTNKTFTVVGLLDELSTDNTKPNYSMD